MSLNRADVRHSPRRQRREALKAIQAGLRDDREQFFEMMEEMRAFATVAWVLYLYITGKE